MYLKLSLKTAPSLYALGLNFRYTFVVRCRGSFYGVSIFSLFYKFIIISYNFQEITVLFCLLCFILPRSAYTFPLPIFSLFAFQFFFYVIMVLLFPNPVFYILLFYSLHNMDIFLYLFQLFLGLILLCLVSLLFFYREAFYLF